MQKIFFIFGLFLMFSCVKEDYTEPVDKNMIGSSNAYVLDVNFISYSTTEILLELDVAAHIGGNAFDYKWLNQNDFLSADFGEFTLTIEGYDTLRNVNPDPYTNLVFMDNSWGMKSYDNFNLRVRALNKMLIEGKKETDNHIGIGAYARDGKYGRDVSFWVFDSSKGIFDQSYEDLAKIAYYSYYDEGGSSNFYDGVDIALDKLIAFPELSNRNLTVIAHNLPDESNTVTSDMVAEKALANNIQINLIAMITDPIDAAAFEMLSLPSRTSGYAGIVSSTSLYEMNGFGVMDKGTPLISSIHKSLTKDVLIYRLQIRLNNPSGTWLSGQNFIVPYEINELLSDGSIGIANYLPFYVKIP